MDQQCCAPKRSWWRSHPLVAQSPVSSDTSSMCFPYLWLRGSLELATVPLLSQYRVMDKFMFGTTSKSCRNFLSQTASFAASQAAMYSTSIAESAMYHCLMLRHTTAPPFRVNTDHDVDFLESLSVWKSESVYSVSVTPQIFEVKFLSFYVNFGEFKIFGVNSFCWFWRGKKKEIEVYAIFFLLLWCKLI